MFVCQGNVYHKRFTPAVHELNVPVVCVNLTIGKDVSASLFSIDKINLMSVKMKDYECKGQIPEWVETIFRQRKCQIKGELPDYDIELQTFPRIFNYVFNPVSFWYLKKNDQVFYVIAEVNNTFGDRHCYLLHENGEPILEDKAYWENKVLHVSPFNKIEGGYKFKFSFSKANRTVQIDYYKKDILIISTFFRGKMMEMNNKNIRRMWLSSPIQSFKVVFLIHLHALFLFFKKVPFYGKNPN